MTQPPLRILQIMAGAAHGGAEAAYIDMCLALKAAGQDVVAVTRPHKIREDVLRQAGITVHLLPFGGAVDIYTRFKIRRIIKAFKPDIVQTWMSRAAQKTPRWTKRMDVPYYPVLARLGGYYKLAHFKETDFFVGNTPDIKRFLIEEGVAPDRAAHINNFAEIEIADAPASRVAENTPEDAKLIVALGRLHKAKAFDVLMRAVTNHPGVHVWIGGEGKLREALEALRAELGLEDRVHFLGWREDRAALLQAADICVVPSRFEPFGNVFVQAWSQKTPLITTASEGPRQYVRDGEDALVVPVDDVDALSAAIGRALGDPALCAKMVENGYKRFLREFTKEQSVGQYMALYRTMMESTPSKR